MKVYFLSERVAKCEHEWEEVKEEEKSNRRIVHRSEYLHHLQHGSYGILCISYMINLNYIYIQLRIRFQKLN